MKPANLVTFIAALLFTGGFILGVTPVHSTDGQNCGSPFASQTDVLRTADGLSQLGSAVRGDSGDSTFADAAAECEAKHNSTRPVILLLMIVGGAGLLAGFVNYARGRKAGTATECGRVAERAAGAPHPITRVLS